MAHGFCRTCYDRRRRSARNFGGYRDRVLARDRCCRVCCASRSLVVHHRRPGVNRPLWHIALCRPCHVQVHRRRQLPGVYSELFFRLWRELHPAWPAQLCFPFAS